MYKEVSVDRNTATETQTLKKGREGRKAGRKPKENNQKPRQPAETQGDAFWRRFLAWSLQSASLTRGQVQKHEQQRLKQSPQV